MTADSVVVFYEVLDGVVNVIDGTKKVVRTMM